MLDVIFQNGESSGADSSFWADLVVSTVGGAAGAFIGLVGALYVYYKQASDAEVLKAKDDYDNQINNLHYTRLLLKKASRFNEQTIPALEKFLARKNKSLSNNNDLVTVSMAIIDEISSIERSKYYLPFIKYFDSGNPDDDYNAVMRSFSTISFIYKETIELINGGTKNIHSIKKEYQELYNKTLEQVSRLGIHAKRLSAKGLVHDVNTLIELGSDFLIAFNTSTAEHKSDIEFCQNLVRNLIKSYLDEGYLYDIPDELADLFYLTLDYLKRLGILYSDINFHAVNMIRQADFYLRSLTEEDVIARKLAKKYRIKPFHHNPPKFISKLFKRTQV